MKIANLIAAGLLLLLVGYNLGLRANLKEVETYKDLYNQAIMWKLDELPRKVANPYLLWKTKG